MKFLVILLCAGINHTWMREKFSFSDSWFISFRSWTDERVSSLFPSLKGREFITLLLSLCVPALVLAGILVWLEGMFFGLPSMLLHGAILLYGFGRINFDQLLQNYQERVRTGDLEGAFRYISELSNDPDSHSVVDSETAHSFFCHYFIYNFFRRLFVVLFLYLLLGPVMVLVYHLLTCDWPAATEEAETRDTTTDESASLVKILEWIPLRLVGLTFSLAGDFTCCFKELKLTFVDTDLTSSELLACYAFAALGEEREVDQSSSTGTEDKQAEQQLGQLHSLLNRSLIIWISIVALFTVYGFGL